MGRFWAFGAADAGINVSASRVVPVASVCAIGTSPLGGAEGRGVSECPSCWRGWHHSKQCHTMSLGSGDRGVAAKISRKSG